MRQVLKRRLIEQQLNGFDDKAFIRLMKIFAGAGLAIILYAAVFSGFQIVDEFEHLHASWLVSIGKVPYKDFFEHHNPLLWYLSAPIASLFYDNAIIFYVMRAVCFSASLLTLWYMYRIVLFFGDKACGWFAVALYLGNIITLYNFYQFRPDNFMNLSFIAGIYYWFCYLRFMRARMLICSFLCFCFSALFLQKISLLLIAVEAIILGLLFLKKMRFRDVSLAAIPACAVMFSFVLFLYFQGALPQYIELNYYFNKALVYYFERGAFWQQDAFFIIYGPALLAVMYFFKKKNIYYKISALIFIAEFLMRGFYFAPHPNYYTLLVILSAMVLSVLIEKLLVKHKALAILLTIVLFLHLGGLFNRLDTSIQTHNSFKHYKLADYVHKNSAFDDYVMNGYDMNFNIYRPDTGYYWFGLDMLLPVMKLEFGGEEKVDVNALMLQYRPKFIYTKNYIDLQAYRTYGESRYAQTFIAELVQALYEPTPFKHLAVLK